MSDQVHDKISAEMDPFKKILGKIPGFKGYVERQNRRDSDKIIREAVANRFETLYQRVSALQRDFVSQGEINYVDDLESAAIKIRTFADRIRRATRGYSGLFDAVKINEEELAKIYEYDASMLDLTDEIDRAIDNIQMSMGTDGLPASIRNLITGTQNCIDVFNKRDEVVLGIDTE